MTVAMHVAAPRPGTLLRGMGEGSDEDAALCSDCDTVVFCTREAARHAPAAAYDALLAAWRERTGRPAIAPDDARKELC